MQNALEEFKNTGAGIVVPWFVSRIASALKAAGRHNEALASIEYALQCIHDGGECWSESFCLRVQGDILSTGPDADLSGAERSYRKAIEIAESQHAVLWKSEAAEALNKLLVSQGRSHEPMN